MSVDRVTDEIDGRTAGRADGDWFSYARPFGLADALRFHRAGHLSRDDFLYGVIRAGGEHALRLENFVEGLLAHAGFAFSLLCHCSSFIRLRASARSGRSVFWLFLKKPCCKIMWLSPMQKTPGDALKRVEYQTVARMHSKLAARN
jgi:hypothetical protein